MTQLNAPVLALVDLDDSNSPTSAGREVLTAATALSTQVTALILADPATASSAAGALGAAGATEVLAADLPSVAAGAADALTGAAQAVSPAVILVPGDYRGKEIAGRAAIGLGSACACDLGDLEVASSGTAVIGTRLALTGSWATTVSVALEGVPVIAVRPGAYEPAEDAADPASAAPPVTVVEADLSPQAAAVQVVSSQRQDSEAGPALTEARTVVVGGRGVDGDFDLVRSLAEPLGAAVGATRVACDEGWIARTAQIGQTGETISPRLYIGLGVSGAIHHTSGIQGAQTIVAVCDDSEAPIFEMADFGVVGDVREVVPQLVAELAALRC